MQPISYRPRICKHKMIEIHIMSIRSVVKHQPQKKNGPNLLLGQSVTFSIFFLEAGYVCQVSFVYVIVANRVNWRSENLQSDTENTGNMKMHFDWVPCLYVFYAHVQNTFL